MKPTKITNRNIMFSEPMGSEYDLNLGLILGVKHNFVIDTGLGSGSVAPILEYLVGDTKPVIVINTHGDWDHYWGNHVFEHCQIIAHPICRETLEKHWDSEVKRNEGKNDGEVRKCLPNVTFEGKLNFVEDGIMIFHTPGHTPCCISVLDMVDKVLYAGDNIGDTEEDILPQINTNKHIFRNTLGFYKGLDFNICISGHNKPQTKEVLLKMEAKLAESWEKLV